MASSSTHPFVRFVLALAVFAALLSGQEARLAGPVSGVVFDPADHALRPLVGVPGASYLGAPLADGLDSAAVAPNGKLAAAVKGGGLYLVNLEAPEAAWQLLAEKAASGAAISWNRVSSAFALHADNHVTVWRNLPGAPDTLDFDAPGGVSSLTVDTRARNVVVACSGPEASQVFLLSQDGPRLITVVDRASSLALANGDRDLWIADRGRNEILSVPDYANGAGAVLFAGQQNGVKDPVALALSQDGGSVMVASAAEKSLVVYDRTTAAITHQLPLEFEPTRLELIGGGALYVMNTRQPDKPLHLFAAGAQPAVYFVPAGNVED